MRINVHELEPGTKSIRRVPKLNIAEYVSSQHLVSQHDPNTVYNLRYRGKKHSSLPHILKFSGGRSSAMLLFILLENNLLRQDRGDVVVFNNTSAEHPSTYEFVRECMQVSRKYGIPFFWIEFQTYEDARYGEWTRLPTYRLVNSAPKSNSNPDGFHWRGEVFEELLSWTGFVPNQFTRTCTKHLKFETTRNFLKDWLGSKSNIPRLGHHGEKSRVDPKYCYEQHRKNSGRVPEKIFRSKRSYVWSRPHFRPEQSFKDFCTNWREFENSTLEEKIFGGKVSFGSDGAEYVSLIGLRGDEPSRVQRIQERSAERGCEGEFVYMPLNEMNVSRNNVNDFWGLQDFDLELSKDTPLSNCVYCFLKGVENLESVHKQLSHEFAPEDTGLAYGSLEGTPSDIDWWKKIDSKYSRDLVAEGREIRSDVSRIGFFGNQEFSYSHLTDGRDVESLKESMLPCDCTE